MFYDSKRYVTILKLHLFHEYNPFLVTPVIVPMRELNIRFFRKDVLQLGLPIINQFI